tara:strand:- start:1907 stop:2650 length:744 start_codon:yes stop_codon:yes gene_type:complete
MEMVHYFGRLQERSHWLQQQVITGGLHDTPPLDKDKVDGDHAEITAEDGVFEFFYADEGGLSLPGLARELVVEKALTLGCDWVMMWDDDMLFDWSSFLRLWRHQKPVIAALAFTARDPIQPVIYKIREEQNADRGRARRSEPVLGYPKNKLISDADIDGPIAFGFGMVLINTHVFRQIPKPWFHSTACGEDWMFCVRCYDHGIPRYVDTSVKTLHKKYDPQWVGEAMYEERREQFPELYEKLAKVIM